MFPFSFIGSKGYSIRAGHLSLQKCIWRLQAILLMTGNWRVKCSVCAWGASHSSKPGQVPPQKVNMVVTNEGMMDRESVPCFANTLQLAMNDGLKIDPMPWLVSVFNTCGLFPSQFCGHRKFKEVARTVYGGQVQTHTIMSVPLDLCPWHACTTPWAATAYHYCPLTQNCQTHWGEALGVEYSYLTEE